jgi:arylsulfatase A-like enzyme
MPSPLRLLGVLLSAAMTVAPALAADRPNILWLIAEDLGPHLGCYGTQQVWTPNLDRLAAQGVRYDNFFTTAPVCSASRSAFMTGMYQTTIGAHNHRSHRDDGRRLPDGAQVLTDWLRPAGYFTANLVRLPQKWDFRGTGKTDWNFLYEGQPFDSDDWADLKSHQPFYAQINFQETHRVNAKRFGRPFTSPKRADPANVDIPPYYPDHPVTREDWAAYLDAATELDRKVGLVLAQLEADGLAERTVVVFFGDNGQAHVRGKQFCYQSGLQVPLLIRWPKAFPPPQGFHAGTVERRLIAAIDLAPTMLAIAGAAQPAKMEGQAFLGQTAAKPREYVFGARDRCDETPARFRTVYDGRWRYIRNYMPDRPLLAPNKYKESQYPVWNLIKQLHAEGKLTPVQDVLAAPHMPPEELYDLRHDAHETRNLAAADDAESRAALARLRAALDTWIAQTGDQGQIPEPPELIAAQGRTTPGNPGAAAIRPKLGHPFACADYSQGKVFLVSAEGKVQWEYPAPSCDDLWVLPNGNLLFNTGHGVKEVTRDKKVVFCYESKSEVYACQRLANGNTFIGECNAGRLLEVDPQGKIVNQIRLLPEGTNGGHAYMRNARRLPNGNSLVCLYAQEVVREVDPQGKVVRDIRALGGPHSAARLPNGNTLIACGDKGKKAQVIEVDPSGQTVWRVGTEELPGIRLCFMTGFQRLPNGNTVLSNWLGHGQFGRAPHLMELTPDKRVVWTFADHKTMRTISSVQLLDVPGDAVRGEILH